MTLTNTKQPVHVMLTALGISPIREVRYTLGRPLRDDHHLPLWEDLASQFREIAKRLRPSRHETASARRRQGDPKKI